MAHVSVFAARFWGDGKHVAAGVSIERGDAGVDRARWRRPVSSRPSASLSWPNPAANMRPAPLRPGLPCALGMAVLTAACVLLGLFPTVFVRLLDPLTQQLTGSKSAGISAWPTASCWRRWRNKPGTISMLGLALTGVCLLPIPLALWLIFGRKARTRRGPTWACGQPGLTPQMEYTATGFSKPVRMIFKALFNRGATCSANTTFRPTLRPTSGLKAILRKFLWNGFTGRCAS